MSLAHLLPAGIGIDDAVAFSAAVAALLAVLAIWHSLVTRDPVARRARALTERRAALRAGARARQGHQMRGSFAQRGISVMRQVVVRFNLLRGRQLGQITTRLTRAGLRTKDALVIYLFAKASLPFAFAVGTLLLAGVLRPQPMGPGLRLFLLCLGFVAGLYGPDLYVRNETDKRKVKLRKGLSDALDLLVICAEAGLSLDAAMTRVGRELTRAYPELADEFSLTALELGFLPDRKQALQNLVERTDLAELRSLVNALIQTERYGTTLAQSLRVLSTEFREERLMRAEEKAAKLPATMTVPMITFILPALLIVLGGAAAIRVFDTLAKLKM
ncbi:MAG TPA: type II secretion system F family protein [Alphaproteobacteria bacterium]|nr:type II secretion system F family protein [Alphaproteobacteria bacterium]